ncbi:MAG: DUF4084 domain-containing protein [Clostridiaceae bacterium]|nr:DUF4084 domain-containing protein [Clostridiaceae bacterium]
MLIKYRRAIIIYLFLYLICSYAWLYFWSNGYQMQAYGIGALSILTSLISLFCLASIYSRSEGKGKYFWLMLFYGNLSYLAALIVLNYSQSFSFIDCQFPNIVNAFILLQYFFYFAALIKKMHEIKATYQTIRYLFDILIVITVVCSISWEFLIKPLFSYSDICTFQTSTLVGYIIGGFGLVFGTASLFLTEKNILPAKTLFLLCTSVGLEIAADSLFALSIINDLYHLGNLAAPLWSLVLLLIGLAGLYYDPHFDKNNNHKPNGPDFAALSLPRLVLPYMSVVILFSIMILQFGKNGFNSLVAGSALAILLIIVRQVFTLLENQSLLKQLYFLNEEQEKKVTQRTRELAEKNKELIKAHQLKDSFIAAMGHELRTPIHSIMSYIQLIEDEEDGPVSDQLKADLEIVNRSAHRLLRLIEDLLNFSKIESGHEEIILEEVDIEKLIYQIREELLYLAVEKGLKFNIIIQNNLGKVVIDRIKVEQILINLVANAIKFTEKGYVTVVACKSHNDMLEISVEDTGIGIPEKYHEHIFECFTQLDGGLKRKYGGTGLGLAIVKKFVEFLEGEISIKSWPGIGSQFTVKLHLR